MKYKAIKDEKFNESNVILEGKARALRDIGMGNRPNRSRPLTQEEEETVELWSARNFHSHGNYQHIMVPSHAALRSERMPRAPYYEH